MVECGRVRFHRQRQMNIRALRTVRCEYDDDRRRLRRRKRKRRKIGLQIGRIERLDLNLCRGNRIGGGEGTVNGICNEDVQSLSASLRQSRGANESGHNRKPFAPSAKAQAVSFTQEEEIDSRSDDQLELAECPLPESRPGTNRRISRKEKGFFPRLLILHTGGTLGMDWEKSYLLDDVADPATPVELVEGTGGTYPEAESLQPGLMLADIVAEIPELRTFASYDTKIVYNRDSCRVGPEEWKILARELHRARDKYEAFIIIHGTDTMAYTATAISLMLSGFGKPIVITGSQLPLAFPRSDARQNLIDSISCATARESANSDKPMLTELAVCFGGWLMRGNRVQKEHTSRYKAFSSPTFPPLAEIGVDIVWNKERLLRNTGLPYKPFFEIDSRVIRIPVIPGSDPRLCYGDLRGRGVRGIVLESFGVGNIPDTDDAGWLPWLTEQREKGLSIFMTTQCHNGHLKPELYRSGMAALQMGVESSADIMTPECATVKLMLALANDEVHMDVPLAGEMTL